MSTVNVSEFQAHGKDYRVVKCPGIMRTLYNVYADGVLVQPALTEDGVIRYLSHVIQGMNHNA